MTEPIVNRPEPLDVESAQKLWDAAGGQLSAATSAYLQALADLEAALGVPSARGDLVRAVDRHLANLSVLDSRVRLNRLRNKCTASMNTLSVEILTRIFLLSVDIVGPMWPRRPSPRPRVYRQLTIIVSVCHMWRRIALGTPTLWSSLALVEKDCNVDNSPIVRLWLERAAGAPGFLMLSRHQVEQPLAISPTLGAHASHFRTLIVDMKSIGDARAIILSWLHHGAPGSVTALSISVLSPFLPLLPIDTVTRGLFDPFLRPLRILRLCNVYFDWGCAAYENLEELKLGSSSPVVVSPENFAKVLSASPHMKSLTLVGVRPRLPISHTLPLGLQALSLDLSLRALENLIPWLTPGAYEVRLKISEHFLPGSNGVGLSPLPIDALRSILPWLQVANVTALWLCKACGADDLYTLFQSLPNLLNIRFDSMHWLFDTSTLQAMKKVQPQNGRSPARNLLSLRTIHIRGGKIQDRNEFKAMISSHTLTRLTLQSAFVTPEHSDVFHHLNPTDELCAWVSGCVQQLLCVYEPSEQLHLDSGFFSFVA